MTQQADGAGLTATSSDQDVSTKVSVDPSSASSPETKTTGQETPSIETKSESSVTAEADELEAFLPKVEEDKSNVQKRINQLIARTKQLEEELELAKSMQKEEPKEKGKPKYTLDQLKGALKKARDEGDIDLEMDVLAYMKESTKDEIVGMYESEKQRVSREQQEIAEEWNGVLKRYDYLSAEAQPELYPGSKKDLNLKDQKSLLFRLASALYLNPETASEYRYKGGQRQAVADALTQILRKRTNPSETSETLKLKKQLDKERMKNSFGSSDAEAETNISENAGLKSPQSKLDEFISNRKKFQSERSRGAGIE